MMSQLDRNVDLRSLAQSIKQAQTANCLSLLTQAAQGNLKSENPSSATSYTSSNDGSVDGRSRSQSMDPSSSKSPTSTPSENTRKTPKILNLVTKQEVDELFQIYFENLNLHCCLLLPHFHTPSLVLSRSPFLFTVVCAITSRFHPANPELHHRLIPLAHQMVFNILENGYRSVEIVQGCLLLTMWGAGHTENYEQERTWLLLGLAIRVATDINLNRLIQVKPMSGLNDTTYRSHVMEVRNRERTWLVCFVLDRSLSAQMGKPYAISEDAIIRSVGSWWRHPLAEPPDSGISAYVEFQRCISRSLEFIYSGTSNVSGIQTNCDYLLVIKSIETQLLTWNNEWQQFRSRLPTSQDRGIEYRKVVGKFYFQYGLLVVNSFGLQNALDHSKVDAAHFFARCHTAASQCAVIVRDELVPRGFLRYSPDSHFVLISYAVLTLLKLSLSDFCKHMHNPERTVALVKDVAECLDKIAAGPQHTPALYATFLRALINAKPIPARPASPPPTGTLSPSNPGPNAPVADNRSLDQAFLVEPASQKTPTFDPTQLPREENDWLAQFTSLGATDQNALFQSTPTQSDFPAYISEMGPVMDSTTFPPLMMPPSSTPGGLDTNMISMDSILSPSFWDNILIPGFSSTFEGLSGGMVYGAGGSGLITPRANSPGPFD